MDAFFALIFMFFTMATLGAGVAAAIAFWIAAILAVACLVACLMVVLAIIAFISDGAAMFFRKLRGAA